MAYRAGPLEVGTIAAGVDLRTNQFRCVVIDGTGRWALAGANARAPGVLQNEPNLAEEANVDDAGITMAAAGAAFALGALLATDATGRLVTAPGGQHVVAVALEAAGGAGQVVTVRLGYRGTA